MTLNRQQHDGVMLCWPTPVYSCQYTDVEWLNNTLRDLIVKRSQQTPGMQTSNSGAWQSESDLLLWKHEAIDYLRLWIHEAATALGCLVTASIGDVQLPEPVAEAWAVMCRDGDYVDLHIHHSTVWAGVYYVDPGHQSNGESGDLELVDPRWAARVASAKPEAALYRIRPCAGLLVAFPSWIYHWVRPARLSGCRVSVAFNVGFHS